MLDGLIIKGVGGKYSVLTKNGIYICDARGLFRLDEIAPLVGDNVSISIVDESKKIGYLMEIYTRKNELIRPKIANVQQVVITVAAQPAPNLAVLDSLLIYCEYIGVQTIICINKADLNSLEALQASYKMALYDVFLVSAYSGLGLEDLRAVLEGKISVFAGPSGVGKSSIINALNSELQLETGKLSHKTQRGKHTTRSATLLQLNQNTFIADTPGFTSFNIDTIKKIELQNYYREFLPYLGQCKYTKCLHSKEQDCKIIEQLGKTIDYGRWERYAKFIE